MSKKQGKLKTAKPKVEEPSVDLQNLPSPLCDREISWLAFNERVLQQALDDTVPLLERVRFLSIFQSNMAEFFMKRIALIRISAFSQSTPQQLRHGYSPRNIFEKIREKVVDQLLRADQCFSNDIYPKLVEQGLEIVRWSQLDEEEKKYCRDYFRQKIFPTLTPLAVDPGHPFPYISNMSWSLAVALRPPSKNEYYFARVKIPFSTPSLIALNAPKWKLRWVPLFDVITNCLDQLFPKMEIVSSFPFRVIRNIEMERREEDADNLLEMIAQELRDRRFEDVVRLETSSDPDRWLLDLLMAELELKNEDVYKISDYAIMDLKPLLDLDLPHLKFPSWNPVTPSRCSEDLDLFQSISQEDILLHHPYENFTASVERFIRQAADDPKVLAIKMTLYRTQEDSSFVDSLIRAAETGKQVVCIVELKARMDEANNIRWATKLESAGVHVVYGILGLKTHCKLALVVRQEGERLRSFSHIGTGNYHGQTAKFYTDFGIITADPEITNEVMEVFNYLSGRSLKSTYDHLLVAPVNYRDSVLSLIDTEISNHRSGLPAEIIFKINNLEDPMVCSKLIEASQAGVPIRLLVRSICTLLPQVKGLTDTIEVRSVVDRFLEHSRTLYFRAGAEEPALGKFFLCSADLMRRNLSGRVEVAVGLENPGHKRRIYDVLEIMWNAKKNNWYMDSEGKYHRLETLDPDELSGQQQLMIRH